MCARTYLLAVATRFETLLFGGPHGREQDVYVPCAQEVSASGGSGGGSPVRVVVSPVTNVPKPAGPLGHRLRCRWLRRFPPADDGAMAHRAAWPAVCCRKQAGWWFQYRHRGCSEGAAR